MVVREVKGRRKRSWSGGREGSKSRYELSTSLFHSVLLNFIKLRVSPPSF